jgi:hypothetical protein
MKVLVSFNPNDTRVSQDREDVVVYLDKLRDYPGKDRTEWNTDSDTRTTREEDWGRRLTKTTSTSTSPEQFLLPLPPSLDSFFFPTRIPFLPGSR